MVIVNQCTFLASNVNSMHYFPKLFAPCLAYSPARFEVATSNRNKKIHYSTFGFKVTQNVVQYLLHHVTYSPAKFDVEEEIHLQGTLGTYYVHTYIRTY